MLMRETHDKYDCKEYVAPLFQEVRKRIHIKLPDGTTQDLTFVMDSTALECAQQRFFRASEAFADTHTYIYTIGDSVRARRIMEGTVGRAI